MEFMSEVFKREGIELRLGRWQEVFSDGIVASTVIGDPPYSRATHEGQRGCRTSSWLGSVKCSGVEYGHLNNEDIEELSAFVSVAARRWIVLFGDHLTAEAFRLGLNDRGLYAFPPVPWIKTDAAPRIMSDGPSPQHETIAIARPRRKLLTEEKRFRPGWYKGKSARRERALGSIFVGQKPLWLMRALVRHYSEPGDCILDPYAGTASTLLAAAIEGRRAIGAEMDPETYEKACRRLSAPIPRMLPGMEPREAPKQMEIGDEDDR
jgi:site-specific DNA-methyltransferase (adenine-specific)